MRSFNSFAFSRQLLQSGFNLIILQKLSPWYVPATPLGLTNWITHERDTGRLLYLSSTVIFNWGHLELSGGIVNLHNREKMEHTFGILGQRPGMLQTFLQYAEQPGHKWQDASWY